MGVRKTTEQFIKEAIEVHGDKYDYSKTEYVSRNHYITVTCPIHGDFNILPRYLLKGKECQKCSNKNRRKKIKWTHDKFIKKVSGIHRGIYEYPEDLTYFTSTTKPIKYICPHHGVIEQMASNHLKSGCKYCAGTIKKTTEQFIKEVKKTHGDKYGYSKTKYVERESKVIITCPIHGDFLQPANRHLRGSGCPNCKISKGEEKIQRFLTENKVKFNQEHKFEGMIFKNPLRCDFYIPFIKTVIEFNGKQHYEPIEYFGGWESFKQTQERDKIKKEYLLKKGIDLIEIKYDISEEYFDSILSKIIFKYGKEESKKNNYDIKIV